ncbi:MAG: ABC transporter ATP-binding protein [Spirochaetaceae bacterium]|jgi:peptide/nickel transport system ATP-binding protein|nr:ABC transporter ATP-binding protein [Spirochaetaceae bacterium]
MSLTNKEKLQEINFFNKKMFKKFAAERKRRIPSEEYQVSMRNCENVLEIEDLHTFFYTEIGTVRAVDGVTINIERGKTVGIVGESGCGKSVTSLSIMRLLHEPHGQIADGQIKFNSEKGAVDLVKLPPKKMDAIRGREISMIFQEPMTTLNPVFTIGKQLDEVLKYHNTEKYSTKEITKRSLDMLNTVEIANAKTVYRMYPHEISGGMRQRVVIAMALICGPKLIIADEPTTALDVTIQAQILDLMRSLKQKTSAAIMLITHDLGVIAEIADYVVVMYAGRVVEQGEVHEIFHNPCHPYTIGLMRSRPDNTSGERLYSIPGNVPNPVNLPDHCFFRNRCEKSVKACAGKYPPFFMVSPTQKSACYLQTGKPTEDRAAEKGPAE